MIELPRSQHSSGHTAPVIKILGIGGAGVNMLDRLMLDGVPAADLVAVNTDAQSLTASVAGDKVQIGRATTRGLGTGGDPELGYIAAEESADELRSVLEGASMVFLLVGLGGGTGSGAAPLIANYARETNAIVIVFATLPFNFERSRRLEQANAALASLQKQADVVVCFENDRMSDSVDPNAAIEEAFDVADQTLSQSVRAIAGMVNQRGLMNVNVDELAATLRGQSARCVFGFGEGEGDNRAHEALGRALKNPLMDRGRLLDESANVIVHLAGGPDLTLNEVQIFMEELNRHIGDETHVLFGCSTDAALRGRLRATIISATGAEVRERPRFATPAAPAPRVARPVAVEPVDEMEPEVEAVEQPQIIEFDQHAANMDRPAAKTSRSTAAAARRPAAEPDKATPGEVKQAVLPFESASRGRFEKSEPTIVNGEDLDVPTFLRRNLKSR